MSDKELLTVPEAAKLLGVPARTVRALVQKGVIPAVQGGSARRPLVSRRRLLAWLEGR